VSDPVCLDRPGDVFDLLLAEIGEGQRQLGAYVIRDRTRHANSARLRKTLQPSRDINGIAEEIFALHHYIADVDADPKSHLLGIRSIGILLPDGLLNLHGALHGIDGAREIGKNAVASRVEDPTAMRGDQAIDDGPVGRERVERANLILPHEAAVALDIGGKDRGELSFDGVRFQGSAPP
jgi:hypothetical protein